MSARPAAVLLTAVLASCGETPTSSKPVVPIVYEILGPADGTAVRQGETVDVRVRVREGPSQLGCTLSMGVEYVRPDGTPDNSYLPGAPDGHGNTPYPFDVALRFQVPIGTPAGNSFIPPGSRVTVVRPGLYCRVGTESQGPGIIARYPVVP